jgi:hypothetical protein
MKGGFPEAQKPKSLKLAIVLAPRLSHPTDVEGSVGALGRELQSARERK